MFDKLKFNNLVISNKKGIQQSRIQTINKLVHKIRKLKTFFEKHPDNAKCKERIRKSTQTMEIIKKLKRVDIMKKLLLMDKPAGAIITNGTSIPEEIATALLSMNKAMQNLIKKFKAELKISGLESEDWKQVLMETSKRKLKIEKTEEKRRKRLELKQQKAVGRKRQEWLEENQPKMETVSLSIEANTSVSTIGDWHVEELSNTSVAEDEDTVNEPTNKLKREMKKEKQKIIKRSPVVPNKKQKILKSVTLNSGAENDTMEETGDTEKINRKSENLEMNDSVKSEEDNSLVVDPFFITDTGENYLSTAINKAECFSGEESNDTREFDQFGGKHLEYNESRNQKRLQNRNKWANQEQQSRTDVKHNRNGKFSRNQFTDNSNSHIRRQQGAFKKDLTNINDNKILHPSWAAKQKLKPIITEFKGRKTTFGDDLNKTSSYSEKYIKSEKSAATKSGSSDQVSLHPSWAAKQKLKPTITAFQGKKITFGNDE